MNKAFGKSVASESLWTEEWPKVSGRYWFYGVRSSIPDKPELMVVKAWSTANKSMVYTTDNMFLYPEEGAKGIWKFLPDPRLPKDKDKLFK